MAALLLSLLAACGGRDDPRSPTTTAQPTEQSSPTASSIPATEPPERDLLDLARRFRGYPYDGPLVARTAPYNHVVGDQASFNLIDLNETSEYTITATVRAVTEHAYFFVDDAASYSQGDIDESAAAFEETVWPTITGAFGDPPTPGVDADPRITILHADLRGAGGYVSASNQYPSGAVPRSAEREMIYVDASTLGSGATYTAITAHELQHLVHIANDSNEESWVNEGLSEVAWEMAGGGSDGVLSFLDQPDTQLNFWPYLENVDVHYSASQLFFTYLLDQYGGRENAEALASIKANGIDGVNEFAGKHGKTFNEVFADFVAANVLDEASGRYSHAAPDATVSEIDEVGAGDDRDATVHQYGANYYRAVTPGTFEFKGAEDVTIGIPEMDGPFWWSNRSDGIDSRLTRRVDLGGVSNALLEFDVWYDIEPGWDYGYVAVSTDEGKTWTALSGEHTTLDDPVGASYGAAYTGASDGWQHESVDLGEYTGQEALLRFEYVTDDATHLTGLAVDNIEIPAIGLNDSGSGDGWTAEGFETISGPMRQEFVVQVIEPGSVEVVEVDEAGFAAFTVDAGAIIAVSAVTPGTTEIASYHWSLQP
jgi:hypothetical protein